jgi:hypothetical protein
MIVSLQVVNISPTPSPPLTYSRYPRNQQPSTYTSATLPTILGREDLQLQSDIRIDTIREIFVNVGSVEFGILDFVCQVFEDFQQDYTSSVYQH